MAVLAIGLGAGAGSAQVPDSIAMASAERFVGLLRAGEWVAAERMVTPTLRGQLGATALEIVWGQMLSSWGAFKAMREKGVTGRDTLQWVELFGDFANDTVLVRVVLSPALEVVGFWVEPVPDRAPSPSPKVVLGAPAYYFYALAERDDIAEAARLDVPLLLLQGERDYQATMPDFGLWQNALQDRPATFRSFALLNHLFVAGSGPATPTEYAQPGFVAEDVIVTIHDWITAGVR